MRRSLPFLVLLLVTTACARSAPSNQGSADQSPVSTVTSNRAAPAAMSGQANRDAGPNVGVSAAPGVAFNYHYQFELPPTRIAEVEEQHAQMCEQLGIARCRITGMLYRVHNDHNIEARLDLQLDPAIARHFGREGVQLVTSAEGRLIESEITGTDVGSRIQQTSRTIAQMQADLDRIEGQLRQPNLDPEERSTLQGQAEQLREEIRAAGADRQDQQQSLATTPMTFNYSSGEPTLAQTADDTGQSFLAGCVILLRVVIVLAPWAIAALLIWGIVILVRRRLPKRKPALAENFEPAPPPQE